jgi:hypothetical protein
MPMKKEGCWIFLSHSSADIKKVRQIRNEFEKHGHNPLAFHLKCLNDDTDEGKNELSDLIIREIDSREWFVFCESPEAQKSEYVKMEKDHIINTGKVNVWSIDMSKPIDEICSLVESICRQIKVFVSYAHRDRELAMRLINVLFEKDFDVWTDENLIAGTPWMDQIDQAINVAAQYGFVLALITDNYLKSSFCRTETLAAIDKEAIVIPLVFGNTDVPEEFTCYRYYRIPDYPSDDDVHLIVELIEAELQRRIKGPIIQSYALNKLKDVYEKLNYEGRYHLQEAELIYTSGASDDYIEVYKFPCCDLKIAVGDGPISRFRADGCCCDKNKK